MLDTEIYHDPHHPAQILTEAPLGALIAFGDGTPKPPERFKRKLSEWKNKNDLGTLVEVSAKRGSFTLHMGDLGSGAVIVMRVYRTFDLGSGLTFNVVRPAQEGSVLCMNTWGGTRKVEKVTDVVGGDAWLARNRYGELHVVGAGGALSLLRAVAPAA